MRTAFAFAAFSGLAVLPALAQETKPAPVITIYREAIKEGRGAAHEKVESEYAAAFRKANFPAHYIALASMSGPGEVWFVQPAPSFATAEEWSKAMDKEPMKSTATMLDSRDGELRSSSRAIWAVYNPALSYHPERFNPGKVRYTTVGTFRIRLGRDEDFEKLGKQYMGAQDKANLEGCTLAYEVIAGAPAGTTLFFTMLESLKQMDGGPERMKKMMDAMGADAFSNMMKSSGDVIASIEDTMFEVRPSMSYATQSMIDSDPAFWKPKPAAMPKAAAAPAEKKGGN